MLVKLSISARMKSRRLFRTEIWSQVRIVIDSWWLTLYTRFQHQLWMFQIHVGYTYIVKIVVVENFGCDLFESFSFTEHTMSWGSARSHKSNRDRCSEGPSNEISTHRDWLVPFSHNIGSLFKTNLHNYRKERFPMNMQLILKMNSVVCSTCSAGYGIQLFVNKLQPLLLMFWKGCG